MEREERVSGGPEPFLARWSRRKQEAREQGAATPEPGPDATPLVPAVPTEPAPRVLTDADMPPLDSLRFEDDWSGFLSPGVSEPLRGAALRRLFSSPELNVTDGLDSYSGDYTAFEALGDTVTADMRHRIERLLASAEQVEPPPDPAVAAGGPPETAAVVAHEPGAVAPADALPGTPEDGPG